MKVSKDKQYKTRNGLTVVILATDVPGTNYPVVGYTIGKFGNTGHYQWTDKGLYDDSFLNPDPNDFDLIELPTVIVEYATVWDDGFQLHQSVWHSTKATAPPLLQSAIWCEPPKKVSHLFTTLSLSDRVKAQRCKDPTKQKGFTPVSFSAYNRLNGKQ